MEPGDTIIDGGNGCSRTPSAAWSMQRLMVCFIWEWGFPAAKMGPETGLLWCRVVPTGLT
ncbi:hypothetical protein ACS0TY_036107 [Phlomoides rotata]